MRNFSEMELKFGPIAAYYCLLEIEKAAQISSAEMQGVDLETRYRNACRAQDEMVMQDAVPSPVTQVA